MAKPNQIRAARALLGWHQKDLARIAGISELSVINIESGKSSPKKETLDKILTAFAMSGVVISADAVEFKDNSVVTLNGLNWFLKIMDDMENTSAAAGPDDTGWTMIHADSRRSVPEEMERMAAAGSKVRQFVEEGNNFFIAGNPSVYKYIPRRHYIKDGLAICYGDKVALVRQTPEQAKVTMFRNAKLAKCMKHISDLLWEYLPTAKHPGPGTGKARKSP
jgi:transcriptional regulator with XRE-family HTH domain